MVLRCFYGLIMSVWLGSVVVRQLDSQSTGHGFSSHPSHRRVLPWSSHSQVLLFCFNFLNNNCYFSQVKNSNLIFWCLAEERLIGYRHRLQSCGLLRQTWTFATTEHSLCGYTAISSFGIRVRWHYTGTLCYIRARAASAVVLQRLQMNLG